MNFYFEDAVNVRTNSVTFVGAGGVSYNAVIDTSFSAESPTEPVTLQEAKDWCRIDVADDDTLIEMLIKGARAICEHAGNLSLITRTVSAKIHNGLGNFVLPYGPVVGDITSFTDVNGEVFTDYVLSDSYGQDMTVVYNAGYATLPENLKTALLCQIAWMYNNRGDVKLASSLSLESSLILKQVRQTG